uniref:Inversin n=1 Tax=Salvator merianae TaxID=96440 RepID=A0A8D0BTJ9_SALMN
MIIVKKLCRQHKFRLDIYVFSKSKGNYRFMKLLLARRASWMKKDLEEITALHLTTRHKNPKCLALLLKYMAPGEIDTQDKNKQTALHWSAYYNNPESVKLLIKHDSNIGIPDIEGKIPLHWAANHKDPSAIHTVKCILDAAPTESLLNWQDYEGRTPLHFAVADGNIAVVNLLSSYEGCNVTSYDNLFRTPLHWAALLGHAQIVHLLLERNKLGTIPSDSQGATPLHYAAQSNFAETVEAFLKHPSVKDDPDLEGRTSFMWAAGKGSNDVIQTMLDLKMDIDINMADKYGGTALHAAALSGHVSTVQLLLKHDAHVDATDVMKHTPLFRACEMGHTEVIQTLIKGGARVDLVDQDGHSPLHWAALGGNPDVCQILIENKINPNVQDYAGRTPLQCAAYGGYINCMVVLLENNANPNIQDKKGRTALHWLCNNGYLDAIKLLLDFGAFPNHMENSEERYTPLDYALLGAHHEVIQFMLEHNALSIAAIQDIAAIKIQAVYKGFKVRKAFQDKKNLLMKHEQLRKDAAAKKREEENRRKASELQEEMQNSQNSKLKVQQEHLSETEGSHANPFPLRRPVQQNYSLVKMPLPSNMSQDQPGIKKKTTATGLLNKTVENKCPSVELLGEDHKRKIEISSTNSKCKPVSVLSPSSNDRLRHQGGAKDQAAFAASRKECQKHKEPSVRANSTNKRHDSGAKTASHKKKPDNQRPSTNSGTNCSEEMAASTRNRGGPNGSATRLSQCKMVLTSKEANDERLSQDSSGRPRSVRKRNGNLRREVSTAVRQASNLTNAKVSPPLHANNTGSGRLTPSPVTTHARGSSEQLDKEAVMVPRHLGNLTHLLQPMSADAAPEPSQSWVQVIQKERVRKELFQKKNCAAAVIQRAWRRYQLQRQLVHCLNAKWQHEEDEGKLQQERTAFCNDIVWNRQPNHSPLKSVSSGKSTKTINKSKIGLKSTQKSSTLKQIYGCSQEGAMHQQGKSSSKYRLTEPQMQSGNELRDFCFLKNTGTLKQSSRSWKSTMPKTQPSTSRHESKT